MQKPRAPRCRKRQDARVNRPITIPRHCRSRSRTRRLPQLLSSFRTGPGINRQSRFPILIHLSLQTVRLPSNRASSNLPVPRALEKLRLQHLLLDVLPALEPMKPQGRRQYLNRHPILPRSWPIFPPERGSTWSALRVIGWKFTPGEAIRPVSSGVKTQGFWTKRIKTGEAICRTGAMSSLEKCFGFWLPLRFSFSPSRLARNRNQTCARCA